MRLIENSLTSGLIDPREKKAKAFSTKWLELLERHATTKLFLIAFFFNWIQGYIRLKYRKYNTENIISARLHLQKNTDSSLSIAKD